MKYLESVKSGCAMRTARSPLSYKSQACMPSRKEACKGLHTAREKRLPASRQQVNTRAIAVNRLCPTSYSLFGCLGPGAFKRGAPAKTSCISCLIARVLSYASFPMDTEWKTLHVPSSCRLTARQSLKAPRRPLAASCPSEER